ncbi:hypothetical protein GSI_15192 [Ganoderma sinense ZZ0214-1]|uniref:Uncharacterized protein n=1 Tax=Ganoderma sinense ZZ0214-1 TaxID=1077348 RepID=A0A2G8RLW8_9APHY|nr:hypothetical protein GSI_15192 [Ganoderma sinense ZZ0214-1]
MAAYYIRHPPSSLSRTSSLATGRGGNDTHDDATRPLNIVSPDQSIYIFPNPPSTPPSPISAGSSLFSVPTDFEPSDSFSSRSRRRTPSIATCAAASTSRESTRQRTSQISDNEVEIDVELWELSTDPDGPDSPSTDDESWVLEEEVQRVGAGNIDVSSVSPIRTPHRARKLSAPQSPNTSAKHYWVLRPQRRSRSHSRLRTNSTVSSSLAPPSARRASPHPRIHIPLLTFFSSMLSVDLDSPALHLLTHSDPGDAESVLFPGLTTAQLASRGMPATRESEQDGGSESESATDTDAAMSADGDEVHGLPKLLLSSLSDPSKSALRSLRAGLAVCIPSAPEASLDILGVSGLVGLWRVVGEVCAKSSQAWKEVWGGPSGSEEGLP